MVVRREGGEGLNLHVIMGRACGDHQALEQI